MSEIENLLNIDVSAVDPSAEADRTLTVCNACRYCEGYCPVFKAITYRRVFDNPDLDYLANLCHQCGACYRACQYAPPHEFGIDVPKALSLLRAENYARYAWPQQAGKLFQHNPTWLSLFTGLCLALLMYLSNSSVSIDETTDSGNFYSIISHSVMVAFAGLTFACASIAIVLSTRRYWRTITDKATLSFSLAALNKAVRAGLNLTHLSKHNKVGCPGDSEEPSPWKRFSHQLTLWGFLLCFVSTCTATAYHYLLGITAPYPYLSIPVLIGTLGGLMLLAGTSGFIYLKFNQRRARQMGQLQLDLTLTTSLWLIALSGLLLLVLRETSAMPALLLVHLGFVFGFFITMPYTKMVHGLFRMLSLALFYAETEDAVSDPAGSE
jgi:citrate/tricarballylate utilization protein